MSTKCKVCGNSTKNSHFRFAERMFGIAESFEYVRCGQCGCLQLTDIPHDLEKFYPPDYYAHEGIVNPVIRFLQKKRADYALYGKSTLGRYAFHRFPNGTLDALQDISLDRGSRILDVGCGRGSLLHSLKDIGFRNVLGIDPFNSADITYRNGLRVLNTMIENISGQWDLVMFNHSFEHESEPLRALMQTSRLIGSKGVCLIRIPIVPSFAWRKYGSDWIQLDPPRHIFIHSIESMHLLAEQSRMVITKTVHDSTSFQFWGSEQIAQGIPLARDKRSFAVDPKRSLFSKKDIAEFDRRAKVLNAQNDGDQAAFFLHNKS